MFVVSDAEATAIRAIFHEKCEFSAAVELRRLFPGIRDTEQARDGVQAIVGWRPRHYPAAGCFPIFTIGYPPSQRPAHGLFGVAAENSPDR